MDIIRNHPIMGFQIVADMDVFEEDVLRGILSHHERQDGTGYPNHLKGDQISLFGRIIAIADIYDAMTSTKPYHSKSTPFKVVEEIEESSFCSLDPQICHVFLKNIINFYPGIMVRLNNEKVGEIIYVNPAERTKPIVHCGEEYYNMTQERYIEIVEMLVEHAH
jgi:HD-GYP domain-containing protein (c-di-GMP phosphodiesterase class II)